MTLNVGSANPGMLFGAAHIQSFTYATGGAGGNTMTFSAAPTPSSWTTGSCSAGACGDDTWQATSGYGGTVLLADDGPTDADPNSQGAWVATNALRRRDDDADADRRPHDRRRHGLALSSTRHRGRRG